MKYTYRRYQADKALQTKQWCITTVFSAPSGELDAALEFVFHRDYFLRADERVVATREKRAMWAAYVASLMQGLSHR